MANGFAIAIMSALRLSMNFLTFESFTDSRLPSTATPATLEWCLPIIIDVVIVFLVLLVSAMWTLAYVFTVRSRATLLQIATQVQWSTLHLVMIALCVYLEDSGGYFNSVLTSDRQKTTSSLLLLLYFPEHANLPKMLSSSLPFHRMLAYTAATGRSSKDSAGQTRLSTGKIVRSGRQPTRSKHSAKASNGDEARVATSKSRKADDAVRLACPFSKHNPARYERVHGHACTVPPGLDGKHVKEHVRRVHSSLPERKCRFCGVAWRSGIDDTRLLEFEQHRQSCQATPEVVANQPEVMTMAQEQAFASIPTLANSNASERWIVLFAKLWPGHPVPNPEYDYFIPMHRARDIVMRESGSPQSHLDNVFSQGSRLSQNSGHALSHMGLQTAADSQIAGANANFEFLDPQWMNSSVAALTLRSGLQLPPSATRREQHPSSFTRRAPSPIPDQSPSLGSQDTDTFSASFQVQPQNDFDTFTEAFLPTQGSARPTSVYGAHTNDNQDLQMPANSSNALDSAYMTGMEDVSAGPFNQLFALEESQLYGIGRSPWDTEPFAIPGDSPQLLPDIPSDVVNGRLSADQVDSRRMSRRSNGADR